LPGLLRTVVRPVARRVAGRLRACCAVGGGGRRRNWLGRIAMLVEESDDVGAVLRIAEAGEGHLGARSERTRAGQPLAEIVPIPGAALLRQRVGKGEPLALADRLAEDIPKVWPQLIGSAL